MKVSMRDKKNTADVYRHSGVLRGMVFWISSADGES